MKEEIKKNQELVKELIDTGELEKIEGNLITLPELKKILKKNSASSIAHLIHSGKLKMRTFMGKHYVTKEDLEFYVYNPIVECSKKNNDYELSKGMKNYLGIVDEEKILNKNDVPKGPKKRILVDDKESEIKPNSPISKIRIRF